MNNAGENILSMELGKGEPSFNGYPSRAISEIILNGFFTVDQYWTVTYWNDAAEQLLGIRAKDILGRNLWEKFADVLPINFYAVYHKAFLQDIPIHFEEYWAERESWFDVITYHCDNTLSVSFKSSSLPAYKAHLKFPEQQMRILNELYKFVTRVTNDCLWEMDIKSREIFWIDGGHKRIFGYDIENALVPQAFWESRIHPTDKARVLNRLNKIIADGLQSTWEEEYRFQKVSGEYAYVHDRGHIMYDSDMIALRMIGATQDITSRKLMEIRLLEEKTAKQKEIANAVITAQEKERWDIGKELHDNLNQVLGAAKMYIEMAKTNEEHSGACLDKASGYIMDVIEEIRKISKRLATPGMEMGMLENIQILIDDVALLHRIRIEFIKEGFLEADIDEKVKLNIFRIVQEQVNNIIKHARTASATIILKRKGHLVMVQISDNGKGVDPVDAKKGIGIINIRSRVEVLGGKLKVQTSPGHGYKLKIIMPVNEPVVKKN